MSGSGGNAFYYFMLEYERDHKKSGKGGFHGGLKTISEIVSPTWQKMSPADKKPYEDQAALAKGSRQKLTTHGQTYEEVDQEKKRQEQKQELMLTTIRTTVADLDRNTGLAYEPFLLLHINYFVKTGDGVYYPAEIGIAEFSIKNGVREPYHSFINPGLLPAGYAYKARQHGDDTHRIDLNEKLGESEVYNIVQAIVDYVGEQENLPPFYTQEIFVPSMEEIVARWAKTCGKPANYFRIYPLEELFFQLKNACMKPMAEREIIDGRVDEGFIFSSVAGKKLGDDPYGYRPFIACQLHEDLDVVQHCSRSYVIRWGWVMCDHLCADMGVERVPGRHCPFNAAPQLSAAKARISQPAALKSNQSKSSTSKSGYSKSNTSYASYDLPQELNFTCQVEAGMSALNVTDRTGFGGVGRGAPPPQAAAIGRGAIPRSAGRGQRGGLAWGAVGGLPAPPSVPNQSGQRGESAWGAVGGLPAAPRVPNQSGQRGGLAWGAVGGLPAAPSVPNQSGQRGESAWGAVGGLPAAPRVPSQRGGSAWGAVGGHLAMTGQTGQFDDEDASSFFPVLSSRKRREAPKPMRQPKTKANVVYCPPHDNWGGDGASAL